MNFEQSRQDLLKVFNAALEAVNGRETVRTALLANMTQEQEVAVIAIGKAAVDMALGVRDALGERVHKGLVVTKLGHSDQAVELGKEFEVHEAEHPVPGPRSLHAGERLLEFCHSLEHINEVIVCISGGASSLVEVLPASLRLDDIQELTQNMLASGLSIERINANRRGLSLIKGGRLATRLQGRKIRTLYISDVPEDDVTVIGSGLLAAKAEQVSTLGSDLFQLPGIPASLSPDSPVFDQVTHEVVANLDLAKSAAAELGVEMGYSVHLHPEFLDQSVEATAIRLVGVLESAPSGLHIWGGETVVELPDNPGQGGRNQHLALMLADRIRNKENWVVLAAGTDGTDGVTEDAGALVDANTIERGELSGRDYTDDMVAFNANAFLEASGDLVTTGPTGTNVMDLLLVVKQ